MANEEKLNGIKSSLEVLKAIRDPAVRAEASKMEDNLKAIIDSNKTLVEDYAKQAKDFDESVVTKYGKTVARVIEFGLVALVAAKMWLLG